MLDCIPAQVTKERRLVEKDFFRQKVCFTEAWCTAFLELSGDKNISLHSASGKRVVQGAALLTKLATFVSEEIPGWAAFEFGGKIKFKKALRMNDTVIMTLKITQVGKVRAVTEYTLYTDDGFMLLQIPITLAHEKLLDRIE